MVAADHATSAILALCTKEPPMPNDLSARLRRHAERLREYDLNLAGVSECADLFRAADLIDQQAAEIERLRAPRERIVSAAVRIGPTAVTFPPPARHGDIMKAIHDINRKLLIKPSDQGFLTSTGRYVTRGEAQLIAVAAGQVSDEPALRGELFSEDLW